MRLFLPGYISVILITFCSCSNNKEENVYQTLNHGLTASYKLINLQNQITLSRLENKTWDVATAEKGKVWYPKALAIKQKSDRLIGYIEKIKGKSFEAGLHDSLEVFKQYVLEIDPLIKR